jgi:uncharacterized protein DUF433
MIVFYHAHKLILLMHRSIEELSHNPDIGELLAAHPDLTRMDVQACLAYAKDIVTGEEVSPKPPKGGRADAAL